MSQSRKTSGQRKPMLTKREIIAQAFEEIGLGTYAYDARPEDLQSARVRLDALLAQWSSDGALTGFNSSKELDVESGVPQDGNRGVICALAIELAPSNGRAVMRDTKIGAREGKRVLMRKAAQSPGKKMNTGSAPAGAGYKEVYDVTLGDADTEVMPNERLST